MKEALKNVVVILYNVTSVHRVIEIAKICSSFSCKNMIIIRPTGAAAQQGVPEAFKICLREGISLSILSELKDVIEIFNIGKLYFLTTEQEGKKISDIVNEIVKVLNSGQKIGIVIHGQDLLFLPRELQLGEPIKILDRNVPSTALLSIMLWELLKNSI